MLPPPGQMTHGRRPPVAAMPRHDQGDFKRHGREMPALPEPMTTAGR